MNATRITSTLLGMVLGAALVLVAGTVGITRADATTLNPDTRPMALCNGDEGPDGQAGPLPCVWDARHMGNGKGHSFLIRPPETGHGYGWVVRITHKRAHRLYLRATR